MWWSDLPDHLSERKLWASHMLVALKDVAGRTGGVSHGRCARMIEALLWFEDDEYYIGSFTWVCELLELNPELIRRRVFSEEEIFTTVISYQFERNRKGKEEEYGNTD